MRKIFSSTRLEGTKLANPKFGEIAYIAAKSYLTVELQSEDGWYVTIYLRPYNKSQTLVTAHAPMLNYLADIKGINKYMAALRLSDTTMKVLNPAKVGSGLFVSYEKDFTGKDKYGTYGCVHRILNKTLSPHIIDRECSDYKALIDVVDEMIYFVNNLDRDISEPMKLPSANWIREVNTQRLKKVIAKCEKDGFGGAFISKTELITDTRLKNFLEENKLVLACNNYNYTFGGYIRDEDLESVGFLFVMFELFDSTFAGSGYMFIIELENLYGWKCKLNLGPLVKDISVMMNDIHKNAWAPLSKSAYKAMPESANIWFYTNIHHDGVMLHRYIDDNDRTDRDAAPATYRVAEPDCIRARYSLNTDRFWTDQNFTNYISNVINMGICIFDEYHNYASVWKKKAGLEIAGEVCKFAINPYRYAINKIFGLDKK